MSIRVLLLLLLLPFLARCSYSGQDASLDMPDLDAGAYHAIAAQVFANETRSQTRLLTYWGEGEDFPSLGIGHFIWFPEGVDAPFDESFPTMIEYLRAQASSCVEEPAWLKRLDPFAAPWTSKQQFDAGQQSPEMRELRDWLEQTADLQAKYIVASFTRRWNELSLPVEQKRALTQVLQTLVNSSRGLYAVVDYYNFKGLGNNPRERYKGEGWGLVQVLSQVAAEANTSSESDLLARFSQAAADRLALRVKNSPTDRNESRWLEGWMRRVAAYKDAGLRVETSIKEFRVSPYLQAPAPTSMKLVWFSARPESGRVSVQPVGDVGASEVRVLDSEPELSCALSYHLLEYKAPGGSYDRPYRHVVQLDNLTPGKSYSYQVRQGSELIVGTFQTPERDPQSVRFIVYADSETEPESAAENVAWPDPDDATDLRTYPVDQRAAYEVNLELIENRKPNFVAIAGDLVESGGEQRDWDEFWRMNASLSRSVPLVAAAGNHEYFGGPGELGAYSDAAAHRAIGKFKTYFPSPTYYAMRYGPVLMIVLDTNAAGPAASVMDTNWFLNERGSGGPAPSWTLDSTQGQWLARTLKSAQENFEFIFVLFHHAPYSSGVHGLPPGVDQQQNFASGRPLRELTPLFMRYGVAAVFNGHDEHYEHSTISGQRLLNDGRQVDHTIHYFTVGIGGDGLRGPEPYAENPHSVFLAHIDAPEQSGDDGRLNAGGKHYGHLEVNLYRDENDRWRARFDPVYLFPSRRDDSSGYEFDRRIYDDVTIIEGAHGWQH